MSHSTPIPFPHREGGNPIFEPGQQEMEVDFAQKFTGLQGKFIYCSGKEELLTHLGDLIALYHWKDVFCREEDLKKIFYEKFAPIISDKDLNTCGASITGCELLVARTGSIVLSAAQQSGRTVSVYAPVHICIAYTDQLVYDIRDALIKLKEKYGNHLPSFINFATGPSRTADIEKTLVVGVHGPGEVYVFLVEKETD